MTTFSPTLTAELPEGWAAKESITVLEPEARANVIASSEPVPADLDAEGYASAQGTLLRTEFPGYNELAYEPMRVFGGRQGFVRQFEWTPEDGTAVCQIQLYFAQAGRGYTATATAPVRDFPRFEQRLWFVLERLLFEERWPEPSTSSGGAEDAAAVGMEP